MMGEISGKDERKGELFAAKKRMDYKGNGGRS
jgi:hypothetical protein